MKLIGLIGKKQSGKDTFCDLATEYVKGSGAIAARLMLPPIRIAFGDALKEEVAKATGMSVYDINRDKARFRRILQWWGTEFRRDMFGFDYWIRRLRESEPWRRHEGLHGRPGLTFVTDVRFVNEARFVEAEGGILIRIFRPDHKAESDPHLSESQLDEIEPDFSVVNNGSLVDFRESVFELMPELMKEIR